MTDIYKNNLAVCQVLKGASSKGQCMGDWGGRTGPCHWVDIPQFKQNETPEIVSLSCERLSEPSEGWRISGTIGFPHKGTHTLETHWTKVLLLYKAVYLTN